MARVSSADNFCLVSTLTDSAWPTNTGTRTVVAEIPIEWSPRIFRVSLTIFISSPVYPDDKKSSMCGKQLNAIWCGYTVDVTSPKLNNCRHCSANSSMASFPVPETD